MSDFPIEHLSDHESWDVVTSCPIGRIAAVTGDQPDIFPVSLVSHDGAVYLKTGPDSRLRRDTEGTRVAIEAAVDNPDGFSSAVCTGVLTVVDDPELVATLDALPIVEFSPFTAAVWLELKPDTIRGRRLHMLAP